MSSILEIFTKAVSTSLVIAKVLTLANTSPSAGWCLVEAARTPLSVVDNFLGFMFSRTPTVSWPNEVINSASDC